LTKPKAPEDLKIRGLTAPLEEQPEKTRRNRAYRRALSRLSYQHLGEFQMLYTEELKRVRLYGHEK